MKNNRYKGKKVDTLGINSDFMKTLIKANTWHGELKLPKPQNNAEIAMLSKFLFGIELSVRFEYCYDKITEIIEKSKYDRYQTDENLRLDAAHDGNGLSCQTMGVTIAIPSFVVGKGNGVGGA